MDNYVVSMGEKKILKLACLKGFLIQYKNEHWFGSLCVFCRSKVGELKSIINWMDKYFAEM